MGLEGWGYSVALGYAKLRERPHIPPNPEPWKGIWSCPSWPKINHFYWLLCHNKILTNGNLQKRGYHEPSRCTLCKECRFSLQIWFDLLCNLNPKFFLPSYTPKLFTNWLNRYPSPPPKNKVIKAAWSSLPKIICWQIWLERNKRIFRNIEENPKAVEVKIKCQLKECLRDLKDDSSLSQQDIDWGSFLDLHFQKAISNVSLSKAWQIRET